MKRNLKNTMSTTTTSSIPADPTVVRLVLTVPEFGNRWGVKKTTVGKWLATGLPHMKFSYRNLRIPVAEADRWLKENHLRQRES
jgi:hypothetical protein